MKGQNKYLYPDELQLSLLAVCVLDLAFFTYYLFTYAIPKKNTISDTLRQDGLYTAVLSISLSIRMLGVCLYFFRYRNVEGGPGCWIISGYTGVFLTLFGWLWLVMHRLDFEHFAGVAVFVAGSSLYSFSLLHFAGIYEFQKQLAVMRWALQVFLVISTSCQMLAFVILWILEEMSGKHEPHVWGTSDDTQTAYIVEHAAYISHLIFYLLFFMFHTPNPMREVGLSVVYGEEHASDPNSVAMRPLLRPAGAGGM